MEDGGTEYTRCLENPLEDIPAAKEDLELRVKTLQAENEHFRRLLLAQQRTETASAEDEHPSPVPRVSDIPGKYNDSQSTVDTEEIRQVHSRGENMINATTGGKKDSAICRCVDDFVRNAEYWAHHKRLSINSNTMLSEIVSEQPSYITQSSKLHTLSYSDDPQAPMPLLERSVSCGNGMSQPWDMRMTKEGEYFYLNIVTNETTWERPQIEGTPTSKNLYPPKALNSGKSSSPTSPPVHFPKRELSRVDAFVDPRKQKTLTKRTSKHNSDDSSPQRVSRVPTRIAPYGTITEDMAFTASDESSPMTPFASGGASFGAVGETGMVNYGSEVSLLALIKSKKGGSSGGKSQE